MELILFAVQYSVYTVPLRSGSAFILPTKCGPIHTGGNALKVSHIYLEIINSILPFKDKFNFFRTWIRVWIAKKGLDTH